VAEAVVGIQSHSQDIAAGGVTGQQLYVWVVTPGSEGWTVTTDAAWLSFSPTDPQMGDATVIWAAEANTGAARTGHLFMANEAFTVNQADGTNGGGGGGNGEPIVPPPDPLEQAIFDAMTAYMQAGNLPNVNAQSTLTGSAINQSIGATKANGDSYTHSYITRGTSIIVSPASTSLGPNQTQKFTAAVYNPDGSLNDTPVQWSMRQGPGTVDPVTGVYTAPASVTDPVNAQVQASVGVGGTISRTDAPTRETSPPTAAWSNATVTVHP
jgi:hypothetical protein